MMMMKKVAVQIHHRLLIAAIPRLLVLMKKILMMFRLLKCFNKTLLYYLCLFLVVEKEIELMQSHQKKKVLCFPK
jgi:hypothetical protein